MNLYSSIVEFIKQLFDSNGTVSSMRFMCVGTVYGILSVWIGLSIYHQMLMDIPTSVVIIFLSALTGKVAQAVIEGNKITTPVQ